MKILLPSLISISQLFVHCMIICIFIINVLLTYFTAMIVQMSLPIFRLVFSIRARSLVCRYMFTVDKSLNAFLTIICFSGAEQYHNLGMILYKPYKTKNDVPLPFFMFFQSCLSIESYFTHITI